MPAKVQRHEFNREASLCNAGIQEFSHEHMGTADEPHFLSHVGRTASGDSATLKSVRRENANVMEEEMRQEEIAAIVGALSAIDMQLQEVEKTALERSQIFREEAEGSQSPTSAQFNTGWHLLREISSEVQEIRGYIDGLEEYVRSGTLEKAKSNDTPKWEKLVRSDQAQVALRNALTSFQKASKALYVIGRALESEELDLYADHLYNLSERFEVEARRARSALESEEE